jgi:hypothetical protein
VNLDPSVMLAVLLVVGAAAFAIFSRPRAAKVEALAEPLRPIKVEAGEPTATEQLVEAFDRAGRTRAAAVLEDRIGTYKANQLLEQFAEAVAPKPTEPPP